LNWDDLKIFLAVARQQKLAAAARLLGIDATTISRRIDRLAADLGTPLFEQSSAGHQLTAGGTQLLRHAEAVERSALAARADVTGERGLLSGVVRVSVAEGFGTWIVARHLAAFRAAHPDIVVELIASSGFLNPSKREADLAVMLARPTSCPLVARRLADKFAQFMIPENWASVQAIPKTSVGKIDKKLLREQVDSGVLTITVETEFAAGG
jgi:DNA-binding transcriptional LysR family regulator